MAIQEAIDMAQTAHNHLKTSFDDDSRPIGQKQLSATDEMAMAELFSSFFGSSSTQDANGNFQSQNQETRAISVISSLQAVADAITADTNSPQPVRIRCTDPSPIATLNDGTRQFIDDDGTTVNVGAPGAFKFCGDSAEMLALTMFERRLILLYPNAISRITNPVVGNQATEFRNDGASLISMRTWSNILLHEFFHAFGGSHFLGDQIGGSTDGEEYGFEGCQNERRNRVDLTVRNPDSLALFALAIAMPLNDWSTGRARSFAQPAAVPKIRRNRLHRKTSPLSPVESAGEEVERNA